MVYASLWCIINYALFVDSHVTHQVHAPYFGSRKITIGCLRYDLWSHFLRRTHLFVFVFICVCISVQWSGDPCLLSWAQYGLLTWTGRGRAFWASDDKTRQWEHGNRFRSGPITKPYCPTPIPIQYNCQAWVKIGRSTLYVVKSIPFQTSEENTLCKFIQTSYIKHFCNFFSFLLHKCYLFF